MRFANATNTNRKSGGGVVERPAVSLEVHRRVLFDPELPSRRHRPSTT
jgi:hypothetical protein